MPIPPHSDDQGDIHHRVRRLAEENARLRRQLSAAQEAEASLQQSEAWYRALAENSYDVICLFSADGELLYISPSVTRALGYDRDELVGRGGPFLLHPDDQPQAAADFARCAGQPGALMRTVHRLRHKDGDYRTVEVTGVNLLAEPGLKAMFSIFHDVTDRVVAEERLRQSEERFRSLVQNAPDAIMLFDVGRNRFLEANDNAARMFGYSREQILRMEPRQLSAACQPDGRVFEQEFRRLLPKVLAGEQVTVEWLYRRSDGGEFLGELRLVDFPSPDGPCLRGSIVDITRRKRQEEQIREQERALAHVSRLSTLGEMVAGIAHEINQPLAAITSYAAACRNAIETDRIESLPVGDWARQIGAQAVRCGDIIRRLRDYVRLDEVDRRLVPLHDIVSDSLAMLNHELRRGCVSVRCELCDPPPQVEANRVQIEQVIVNLLRNACQAVCQQPQGSRRIEIRTHLAAGLVRLTVRDNGPGVPAERQQRLFQAFQTSKPDGMGLGLAISKSISESHQGRLWHDSEAAGAVFHLDLPLPASGDSPPAAAPS